MQALPVRLARCFAFSAAAALCAAVPAYAECIDPFEVDLDVRADGAAIVVETIRYDFEGAQRHGIYRDIPIRYQDATGREHEISISGVAVADDTGAAHPIETSTSGGRLHIRIGDPGTFVSGVKTYRISYTAHDVVGFFPDHDEIYWNVTGNAWDVPIESAQVRVTVPGTIMSAACYQGVSGSRDSCQSIEQTGESSARFSSRALAPREGLTIAVGFPKGIVAGPTFVERLRRAVLIWWPVLVPIGLLAFLFRRWQSIGRDAPGRGTIIPEYDLPRGVAPLMAAQVFRQRIRSSEISAEIVRLAIAGHLCIAREDSKTLGIFSKTDYRLEKRRDAEEGSIESTLMDALFSKGETVLISDLAKGGKMQKVYGTIAKRVAKASVSEGYFRTDPAKVAAPLVILGIVFIFGDIMLTSLATETGGDPLVMFLSALAAALISFLFAYLMPARTEKGIALYEHLLGLKDYLRIAEKNRLDFHNAPERTPQLFEKLLPIAMVLGVSEAWAKEFEGIYTEPPEWYAGGVYPVFSPTAFASDMTTFSAAAAAVAAPASGGGGAGGGGSSGGGFGGGGGGSW